MSDSAWQLFHLSELAKKVDGSEPRFYEFLRVSKLSGAIYRLPAGARDMQAPHLEDEVYVVLDGRAPVADDLPQLGYLEEDLTVLAFFGSPIPD